MVIFGEFIKKNIRFEILKMYIIPIIWRKKLDIA